MALANSSAEFILPSELGFQEAAMPQMLYHREVQDLRHRAARSSGEVGEMRRTAPRAGILSLIWRYVLGIRPRSRYT